MAESLTIAYLHKEEVQEKVGEPGKFLFFSWSGYKPVRYCVYAVGIQFPNGEKKIVEYDRQKFEWRGKEYLPDSPDERKRIETVQKVVNDLEHQGFSVPADQLALFLQVRIELLIMQKK